MFIDEKGKLFGKLNLIDLLIIIVLVVAAGILGYKFLSPALSSTEAATAVVQFYAEEVSDFVLDGNHIQVGDPLLDEVKNVSLGTITKIEIDDPVSYGTDDQGRVVTSQRPHHKSLLITAEVPAQQYEHGMIVNASRYYVGHTFVLLAGQAKLYLRVYDISFKE